MSASNVAVLKIKSMWKNGIPELQMLMRLRNNLILFFSVHTANIFTVILLGKGGVSKRTAGFCTARQTNVPEWGTLGRICGDIISIEDARVSHKSPSAVTPTVWARCLGQYRIRVCLHPQRSRTSVKSLKYPWWNLSDVLFFLIPSIVLIWMTTPQLSPQMNLTSLPRREVVCVSIILN